MKMFEANEIKRNTVSAENQLKPSSLVQIFDEEEATLRILFVGNSITYHEPKTEIGWTGAWGMAASKLEKDYVHQVVQMLRKHYGKVGFAIAQLARWELDFDCEPEQWQQPYMRTKQINSDIVVIRMGENISMEKMERIYPKSYIASMIGYFAHDCHQVIVTDCFWRREKLDMILEEICIENEYTFCKISDLYEDKRTMALSEYTHPGVALHPSDYGMQKIAKRVIEKVMMGKWGN